MKIIVTGTRGIPNIQGGIETHCEELYPRLVKLGFEVSLLRRSCSVPVNDKLKEYKGIKLFTIFTIRKRTMETIIHTFLSVCWAKWHNADILQIHAVGPALLTPFARLLGLKVVFTHHGPDYDRAKWGPFAKFVLRLGERFGTKYANEVIVISEVIQNLILEKYNRNDSNLIYNGVSLPVIDSKCDYIESLGLKPRNYVFTLGRFVEEKGFDYLIRAFDNLNQDEYKLVIAGDADHEMPYAKQLKKLAKEKNVLLTGFVKGEELKQLFNNARIFVLPSFHEGLPISLLEAMSYRLPVLISDIPAHKQILLPDSKLFITGNEDSLTENLKQQLRQEFKPIDYDMSKYDWNHITLQTAEIYRKFQKK
jgi:glycosyltransferase involved in cell wall biosynthesis